MQWEFCDMVIISGKSMTKKSFVVILVLSALISIGIPLVGFTMGIYQIMSGWPLEFSQFNFLGSSTNYTNLFLDIIFWFIVIWGIWRLLRKTSKK